jgi:GAG-pre-integrase domain/Zinc knuckle
MVGEIRSLGTKLDDSEVVEKLFSSVLDRFLHIIGMIEQFGDIKNMSVSEAIGRLGTFEEGLKGRQQSKDGGEQLLLTQAEWEARCTKGKKDQGFNNANKGGRHGRGRGRGRRQRGSRGNEDRTGNDKELSKLDKFKIKCYNCNEYKHFAKECPKPNRREQRANLVSKQGDDELALLMAEVCDFIQTIPTEEVLLHEDMVIPKSNSNQEKAWYLDTGASNHMTGCIEKFAEIYTAIRGSVKFGDGSAVDIHGRSSVLLECSTGEHRLLTDVYYIPMLRSNIISLGQLDENGCQIVVKGGVMTIIDRTHKLFAKVGRSKNRLYTMHITPALPECFLTRSKEEAWRWHARYGHVNFHALKDLSHKKMVHDLPMIAQEDRICDGCLIGKQHRNFFPAEAKYRAKFPLELWHVDLCGPINAATHGGKRYFMLIVDDCIRFMW